MELKALLEKDAASRNTCIPSIDVFKEIMVELIKNREICMETLRKEKREFITEHVNDFQLNDMLLSLTENSKDNHTDRRKIQKIFTDRSNDGRIVEFEKVLDAFGNEKTIRCTNVVIRVKLGG